MEKKLKILEKELAGAKAEIAELTKQKEIAEKQRDDFKNKYFYFKNVFQKQTKIFYLYQGLSEHSLEALNGIFKEDSFENFLACGVQPDNIDALWEFARSEAILNNTEDVNIINTVIQYFVKLYNDTNETPVLAIQKVSTGDTFDVDLHIRTPESKAAGTIQKVILPGLTNAFTGAVIKKSVVIVNS